MESKLENNFIFLNLSLIIRENPIQSTQTITPAIISTSAINTLTPNKIPTPALTNNHQQPQQSFTSLWPEHEDDSIKRITQHHMNVLMKEDAWLEDVHIDGNVFYLILLDFLSSLPKFS